MQELHMGDLVDVMASGKIESISESGYMVRVHGELVPFVKTQVQPFSPSIYTSLSSNEIILTMLKELAQGEVIDYASEIDGSALYACPFCSPGSAYESNEGQHEPTCLVRRAQEFLTQETQKKQP